MKCVFTSRRPFCHLPSFVKGSAWQIKQFQKIPVLRITHLAKISPVELVGFSTCSRHLTVDSTATDESVRNELKQETVKININPNAPNGMNKRQFIQKLKSIEKVNGMQDQEMVQWINETNVKETLEDMSQIELECEFKMDLDGNPAGEDKTIKFEESAMRMLAGGYADGKYGLPKDVQMAFKYFLQLAHSGDSYSQLIVGLMYIKGYDIILENDIAEGLAVNDVHLFYKLKDYFQRDTGKFIDEKVKKRRLVKELKKSAMIFDKSKTAKPKGISDLVWTVELKENFSIGIQWLQSAVERGETLAQVHLARLIFDAKVKDMNMKHAYYLIEDASRKMNPYALYAMACFHYDGLYLPKTIKNQGSCGSSQQNESDIDPLDDVSINIEVDIPKSIQLFEQSANFGFLPAQYWLGYAYHQGIADCLEKDYQKAMKYLSDAAESKYGDALYYLAMMHKSGDGVEKDEQKWKQYFSEALELENAHALYYLADKHYHGSNGYKRDTHTAFDIYLRAAHAGHADAWYCIGVMYYNGEGIEKDTRRAYDAYCQATSMGHLKAMANVALMNLKGDGIPKNLKYAEHLLQVLEVAKAEKSGVSPENIEFPKMPALPQGIRFDPQS